MGGLTSMSKPVKWNGQFRIVKIINIIGDDQNKDRSLALLHRNTITLITKSNQLSFDPYLGLWHLGNFHTGKPNQAKGQKNKSWEQDKKQNQENR